MNKIIEKNYKQIFLTFLFLQPILDLITSLFINVFETNITIGIIVRVIFLLFTIYYGIFIDKDNLRKKIIYLSLISLYSIIFLIVNYVNINLLFIEVQNLVKVLYLPILLLFVKKIKIEDKYLVKILSIYAILILVPTILGINFNAYTQGKIGSIGFFNSANEISAIFTILFPVLFIFSMKKDIKKILYLLCVVPMFMIGSKVVIGAIFLTILLIIPVYFKKNKFNKKKSLTGAIIIITIITCSILLIPKTNFYKNIVIHAEFLEINEISDLFSLESIDRFLFSDRLTYLENIHKYYIESNLENKFFGIGYTFQEKLIEMDVFDIFYRFGIIGFILIFYPLIHKLRKIYYKHNIIHLIPLLMILILSFMVGHTLVAPAVSVYIVVIINNLSYKKNMVKST